MGVGILMTLKLYTFCVDINRNKITTLNAQLNTLINSLDAFTKDYELILYSNYLKEFSHDKVILREYYDNAEEKYYKESDVASWLNLSFNKLSIYYDLLNETGDSYAWVDLDTIFCADMSYLEALDNFFITTNGDIEKPHPIFNNNEDYVIPYKDYIQGNFWKLNYELYHSMKNVLHELNEQGLVLQYDCQSLFNYCHYYLDYKLNLLGNNLYENTIYGLGVWSEHNEEDGNNYIKSSKVYNLKMIDGELFFMDSLKSPIHLWSFTNTSYESLLTVKEFYKIINNLLGG